MWGIGASTGPYIMGYVLTGGGNWNGGYRLISLLQMALTVVLVLSLPLWKRDVSEGMSGECRRKALSLPQILHIPGAKAVMLCFFCYCAVEQTAGLWAASYLTLHKGISADIAAGYASLFFVGITVGRALGGFLTLKLNDGQMIRLGQSFVLVGILFLFLPFGGGSALAGLILIGLGCAPIYPSIIHSTPERFGADKSQAIIGVQMASAYVGTCVMPPVFGVIANHISVSLLPVYLLLILALMVFMHEKLIKTTKANRMEKKDVC